MMQMTLMIVNTVITLLNIVITLLNTVITLLYTVIILFYSVKKSTVMSWNFDHIAFDVYKCLKMEEIQLLVDSTH